MFNFDSLTLKALLREIAPIIENARIQKIRQISRQELIFVLRNNSKNYTLFISTKPSFAHLCLLEEKNKKYRILDLPKVPPMFCMLLRKYMENTKIEKVFQPKHERIIEFYFTSIGELGERTKMVLSIELMGKHSNMILYNEKSKTIIGCAHNVGEEKSKTRELAGGLNYVYPPKTYKKDIFEISQEEFLSFSKSINTTFPNWLNETFYDISIPLAKEICEKFKIPTENDTFFAVSQDILKKLYVQIKETLSLEKVIPSISEDFKEFSISGKYTIKPISTNDMVDIYFGKNSYDEILEQKRRSIKNIVDREIKKIKRFIKKLSIGKDFEEKITLYKQTADTLMANIHIKQPAKNKIELENVYTSEKIIIDIDETLSINDNAQKYYKLYTKAKKTNETNQDLYKKYKEKELYLISIISSLDLANDMETLFEIEEEANELLPLKQNEKTKKEVKKINIEKILFDGFEIFIGKNNKQNDYIVSKLSSAEDFWFHVHGNFGSHVLVKNKDKKALLPDDVILKAATLAAKYSEKKKDSKADVIYTKRKYLRKPPGANLGYVTYKNEKEITVDLNK